MTTPFQTFDPKSLLFQGGSHVHGSTEFLLEAFQPAITVLAQMDGTFFADVEKTFGEVLQVRDKVPSAANLALLMLHHEDPQVRAAGERGLQQLADAGNNTARYNVAILHLCGKWPAPDFHAAVGYLSKVLETETTDLYTKGFAANALGDCYVDGRGVELDVAKGHDLYALAASLDVTPAAFKMGLYYEGKEFPSHKGPVDHEQAAEFYRMAADFYEPAKTKLGLLYVAGRVPGYGREDGWDLLADAAENGEADAAAFLTDHVGKSLLDLHAAFRQLLLGMFREWLNTGRVDVDQPGPPRYKTLGQFVSEHVIQTRGWERQKVSEFLATPSADGTLENTLRNWFKQCIPWLTEAGLRLAHQQNTDPQVRDAMNAIAAQYRTDAGGEHLLNNLMFIVLSDVGDLTIMNTFRRRRAPTTFASISRQNQERLQFAQELPTVAPENSEEPRLFFAIDSVSQSDATAGVCRWVGGAKREADESWRSIAAGRAYHFNPECPDRTLQLQRAAASVSSADASRVNAFVTGNATCEAILRKGDIAFVAEWERAEGSLPGDGAECLLATCARLRTDYPELRSIVFSLSAQRFAPRAAHEPALVTEGRLADLDRLHEYVSGLSTRLGLDVYVVGTDAHDVSQSLELRAGLK